MSALERDRFHKAARDGYLDLLREATRRDCNTPDEDGMTPTLWAAYYGNLDALRLLTGRGGDPDKCDYFGNTALHCACTNGHMNCVSFLVNFGVNLWSLDNDFHTAKDIAALKQRDEILRFLDQAIAKQSALNKKLVQRLKEKALQEAEKRIKQYQKLQKKAAKKAEKDDKFLEKQRKTMNEGEQTKTVKVFPVSGIRRDSRLLYNASPKYSEIVNNSTTTKKGLGAVSKKVHQKKQQENTVSDFKVREQESDGKRSMRSLSGLRRDNEIMYLPKAYNSHVKVQNQRRHMKDVFIKNGNGELSRATSEPDFLHATDSDDGGVLTEPGSIFERPGFGSMAFRKSSLSGTLLSLPSHNEDGSEDTIPLAIEKNSDIPNGSFDDSIGSAGSLAQRNGQTLWEDDESNIEEEEGAETSPLIIFLAAHSMTEYIPLFTKEKIDLEALTLLNEEDLKNLGLPLGPRKKLLKAIQQRKATIMDPGKVFDSLL